MTVYPRYSNYKSSSQDWLGNIPAHWNNSRLKFACVVNPSKTETSHLSQETVVSFVPMERLGNGTLDVAETRPLSVVRQGFTYFRDGDVIVAKITPSFENGKGAVALGLMNEIGFGTTELHVLRAANASDPSFLYYLTLSQQFRGMGTTQMSGTAGQKRVPDSFINDFPTPLPTLPEQRAIATYLDRETARIDALIDKKRQLIDLLTRQRAALISRAVTKGLDPHAKLKPSGVEWLGDVPEDWEVMKLKRVSVIRYGLGQPPPEKPNGIPFVRATNVNSGEITKRGMLYVEENDVINNRNARLSKDEIIVVRSGAYTGDSAIVPEEYAGAIAGYDMVVNVKRGLNAFLAWQFLSPHIRDFQFGSLKLRAAQPHLNAEELGNTVIMFPPYSEQHAIVAHLDRETKRMDSLITKIETSINLLQRQRVALISAVVTGKIDVRGL